MRGARARIFIGIALLCVASRGWAAGSTNAEDLFQDALVAESADRDLDKALSLYTQVIQRASGNDPLLADKARLRAASCYEREGRVLEAEELYQQILQEKAPPSPRLTQTAKDRLAQLTHPATTVVAIPPPVHEPFSRDWVSVAMGMEYFNTGHSAAVAPSAAVRCGFGPRYADTSIFRPDAVEAAGLWSHVPSDFSQSTLTFGGVTSSAQTQSLTEEQFIVLWEFLRSKSFTPEAGLGLAWAHFRDIETAGLYPGLSMQEQALSQVTQLGGTYAFTSRVSLNMAVGYERFANHFIDSDNFNFDLVVSALTVRLMLEVRL